MKNIENQDSTEAEKMKEWDLKIAFMEKQILVNRERRRVNDEFNDRLEKISRADKDHRPLELGNPSGILILSGIPDLPIEMTPKTLVDKRIQKNHPFELMSVRNMPDALVEPIAVFRSCSDANNSDNCKVILTELVEADINFTVIIEQNRKLKDRYVNTIISLYRKKAISIMQWILNGELIYVNKEKTLNWLGKQRSNFDEITRLIEGSTKVINQFVNPSSL
jgi:hypothetical protein